jgi:hypothetical protein
MDGAPGNRTTAGDLMRLNPSECRRSSFNLRMVSPFCGNENPDLRVDFGGGNPYFQVAFSSSRLPRGAFQSRPITIPNYNRKTDRFSVLDTDRHRFGIMIDVSSEPSSTSLGIRKPTTPDEFRTRSAR